MTQPAGGYTADEIAGVTSSLVQTSVRYQTDALGVRQLSVTFNDVQQAAIGIFLLFPTAPFYAVSLGASRLNEELQVQAENVAELLSLVQATGRTVLPVNDITPLANANAALFNLQAAASSRTTPFSSIADAPAYKNFSSNVDAFLADNASNVVSGGEIVPTPQDAKSQISSLLSTILSTQQDLVTKAGYLQNALSDYNSADLPAVATSSVFANASQNIAALVSQLTPQSPTQRLSTLRNTVLQLLAARAVISGMGSAAQPSNIYPISGTGTPYSDATHKANPAVLAADTYAPYGISSSPIITIGLDGQAAQSGNLSNSLFAELFGTKTEPFVFQTISHATFQAEIIGPYTVATNTFSFTGSLPNSPPIFVNLTSTLTGVVTAAALAADLNTQLASTPLASYYQFTTDVSTNYLVLEAIIGGSDFGFTVGPGTLNIIVGIPMGTQSAGVLTNTQLKIMETTSSSLYAPVIPPGTYSAASFVSYFNSLSLPFTAFAQGNVGSQFIDIRYTGSSPTPTFEAGIQFPTSGNAAASVLGMPLGITVNAQPSTARSVAKNLNSLFSTLDVTVEVDPIARASNINIRSEPTNPSEFVAYLTSGSGTAAPDGVDTIELTVPAGLLAAGVEVNDILVIRSGANANTKWTISAVTDTSVVAVGTVTAVSGSCTYEIGPPFSSVTYGYVVQIVSGINAGIYTIVSKGPTSLGVPFEFVVNAVVHGVVQPNGLPYVTVGNIGQEKVVFNSENETTSSAISVSGAASALFFTGSPPFTSVGTSPWLLLPQTVPGLSTDDAVAYYGTQYNQTSYLSDITSVNGKIVGLANPIEDTLTLDFNDGVPPPFALLENGAYATFINFSGQLEAWLNQEANGSSFTSKLQVALNVVVQEGQATAAQINTAIELVQELQNILVQASSSEPSETLEYALVNYQVNRVASIDNLVSTYSEKGSDRAIDMLLQGQFAEFFGLDQSSVSYAGAMQSKTRAVAMNDLPVRRVDRTSTVTSPVLASATTPDFEYDQSDIDTTTAPTTPSMFEQVSPTDANNP